MQLQGSVDKDGGADSKRFSCGISTGFMTYYCGRRTGEWDARFKTGFATGNAGPDGFADADGDGCTARLWDCASDRAGERKRGAAESGNDLCVAGAAAAAGLDRGGVGDLGEQPEGEVLHHHEAGAEAASGGCGLLAEAVGGDGAGAGDGSGRR